MKKYFVLSLLFSAKLFAGDCQLSVSDDYTRQLLLSKEGEIILRSKGPAIKSYADFDAALESLRAQGECAGLEVKGVQCSRALMWTERAYDNGHVFRDFVESLFVGDNLMPLRTGAKDGKSIDLTLESLKKYGLCEEVQVFNTPTCFKSYLSIEGEIIPESYRLDLSYADPRFDSRASMSEISKIEFCQHLIEE